MATRGMSTSRPLLVRWRQHHHLKLRDRQPLEEMWMLSVGEEVEAGEKVRGVRRVMASFAGIYTGRAPKPRYRPINRSKQSR